MNIAAEAVQHLAKYLDDFVISEKLYKENNWVSYLILLHSEYIRNLADWLQ